MPLAPGGTRFSSLRSAGVAGPADATGSLPSSLPDSRQVRMGAAERPMRHPHAERGDEWAIHLPISRFGYSAMRRLRKERSVVGSTGGDGGCQIYVLQLAGPFDTRWCNSALAPIPCGCFG
jgi:hypothetical protein